MKSAESTKKTYHHHHRDDPSVADRAKAKIRAKNEEESDEDSDEDHIPGLNPLPRKVTPPPHIVITKQMVCFNCIIYCLIIILDIARRRERRWRGERPGVIQTAAAFDEKQSQLRPRLGHERVEPQRRLFQLQTHKVSLITTATSTTPFD